MHKMCEKQIKNGDVFVPDEETIVYGYSGIELLKILKDAKKDIQKLIDEEQEKVCYESEELISDEEQQDIAYERIKDKFEEMGLLKFFERVM